METPPLNNDSELPGGFYSVSNIQYCFEYIKKNMNHHLRILPFVFTSIGLMIDLIIVFKIKGGFKLELQTP